MPTKVIARNKQEDRNIEFWAESKDKLSAKGFGCPRYEKRDKKQVAHNYLHFLETGKFPPNKHKFKQVENEKFFRIAGHQIRLYGDFIGKNCFVVFYCDIKKQNKMKQSLLEVLRRLHEQMKSELVGD